MKSRPALPGNHRTPGPCVRRLRDGILAVWNVSTRAVVTVLATIFGVSYFAMVRAIATPIGLTARLFQQPALHSFMRAHSTLTVAISSLCIILIHIAVAHGSPGSELPRVLAAAPIYLIFMTTFVSAAQYMERIPDTPEEIERDIEQRWPGKWFRARLRKSCDAYFVRHALDSTLYALPSTCLLFFTDFGDLDCIFVIGFYYLSLTRANSRAEMVDHTEIHNRIFRCRRDCSPADKVIVWILRNGWTYVLAPLCLRAPNSYRVEHLYVHHVENNGLADTQSTLPYDRASFIDFCMLAFKCGISLSLPIDVSLYLLRRNKRRPLRQLWAGILVWYGGLGIIAIFHWEAATIMMATRFLGGGIFAASTVLAWHGLVDVDEPENIYKNTLNSFMEGTHGIFGSAFHVEHHIFPGCHWSELQARARENDNKHIEFGAVEIMDLGLGNRLLAALWLKRFDWIASYCLRIGRYAAERSDLTSIIERRTRPCSGNGRTGIPRRIDEFLGRLVAKHLLVGPVGGASEPELAAIHRENSERKKLLEGATVLVVKLTGPDSQEVS